MRDPAALAIFIPFVGGICVALIAGLFSLAGKRSDAQVAEAQAAERSRREVVDDFKERIAMLTTDRDDARAERDRHRQQVVQLERQVADLEHIVEGLRGTSRRGKA